MKTYIDQIRENQDVEGTFVVTEKNVATSRSGSPYLRLKLSDRTGEIEARIWDESEVLGSLFERGDVITIKGHAGSFQDRLQLNIKALKKCPDNEVVLEDFLPTAPRPADQMLKELNDISTTITNPYLRTLVMAFLEDNDFLAVFQRLPAAKRLHHVYLGGLLEHTLSVAQLAQRIEGQYPDIDRDLLLTGAVLHDVGKVRELSCVLGFDYTDEGRLLGHIAMGMDMVSQRMNQIHGFPEELAMLVKHLMLSHHGQYEFGSPRRPKTPEAEILYRLDDLDAKINGIQAFMRQGNDGSRWTDYHRIFDRFFYLASGEATFPLSPPDADLLSDN